MNPKISRIDFLPQSRRLAAVFHYLAWTLLAVGAVVFIAGASKTVQQNLGDISRYYSFSVFAFIFAAATSAAIAGIFRALEVKRVTGSEPSRPKEVAPSSKYIVVFQVVVSLLILAQTVSQINMPFDLDENQRAAAAVTKSFWHEINPFRHTEVHAVAHVFAIASINIFGENKIAFRLPSIVFAILFLYVLNLLANRCLTPFSRILLFSHLMVNQLIVWYLHAMRGYVSSLFVTSVLLFILLEFTQGKSPLSRGRLLVFSSFFALSALTHPFTGIYTLLLLVALIQWLFFERKELDLQRLQFGTKMVAGAMISLPLFLAIFVCVLRSLEPIRNIHFGGYENFVTRVLLTLPSLGRVWALKLIALAMAYCGIVQWVRYRKIKFDFISIFVLNVFAFYAAVLWLLKVSHLETRWFIPFIVPIVIWVGEWISAGPGRARYAVCAVVLAIFTVLPFKLRKGMLDTVGILHHQPYEAFLADVRKLTAPVSENCYEFSDVYTGYWASTFHFSDAPRHLLEKADCQDHYFVSLAQKPEEPKLPSERILDASNGNVLYRITP